jgi:hypothetical protein
MASINEHTGDKMQTKARDVEKYEKNWESIFSKKDPKTLSPLDTHVIYKKSPCQCHGDSHESTT